MDVFLVGSLSSWDVGPFGETHEGCILVPRVWQSVRKMTRIIFGGGSDSDNCLNFQGCCTVNITCPFLSPLIFCTRIHTGSPLHMYFFEASVPSIVPYHF